MITLYDYETSMPGKTISPWVMKVRLALNYKGLPHKTVWFGPFDMEEHAKPLGLPANQTEIADDGTVGRYTVPVLHDSSTGEAISDSTRIIEYLDEAYPDTPRIIHPETKTLAVAYEHTRFTEICKTAVKNVVLHIYATITPRVGSFMSSRVMSPEDELKYREMVKKNAGVDHTELVANKEVVEGMWEKAEEGLTLLDGYFRMAKLKFGPESEGVKGGFLEGSKPGLADFSLGGFLIWMKRGLGETDEQWKRIESWNDGRWAKYLDAMKPYSEIDE
ncbi:hypothetical protein FA13DRAFT_1749254 [Coprinellus micaceus]|uniref:GST N-terminal domain-containing protein n=1 Tax=Coprinellus micaceus TaxID=71717 RepID=A0A4Y7RMW3_COPMI|nr:hypothetical protein FA13DRAFT_1749254 [Coprinellus micaceus]